MTQQYYDHQDRNRHIPFSEDVPHHRSADFIVWTVCVAAGMFLVFWL